MEKLLDSISGFVDSKLRNPFINTFIIAWIAYNWKPILFFTFSKFSAGKKIWIISRYYSDIRDVIFYPVGWTILVLIAVPAILAGVEFVDKFITKFRLKSARDIAIARNLTEDNILAARQIGNVNQYISQLQEKIDLYEKDLSSERTKNIDQIKNYTEVIKNLNEEIKRLNTEFSEEVRKNMEQQEKMSEEIKTAKAQVRSLDQQHYNREDERMAIIQRYEQEAEERNRKTDFIIDRLRNRKTKLIDYSEGQILEIEENGEMVFYDLAKNKFYNFDDLYQLYNSYPTFEIDDFYIIDQAIEKFKNRK